MTLQSQIDKVQAEVETETTLLRLMGDNVLLSREAFQALLLRYYYAGRGDEAALRQRLGRRIDDD